MVVRGARFLAVLVFTLPLMASGEGRDWAVLAQEEEIVVTVEQEDGTPRDVVIWIVEVDGTGYIRSRGTNWRADMERNPDVSLRIAGVDYPVRAAAVTDEALIERVTDAFTEKYGITAQISLGLLRPFLGPYVPFRLDAR